MAPGHPVRHHLPVFSVPKLPGLAPSVGPSMRILKREVSGLNDNYSADGTEPSSPPK